MSDILSGSKPSLNGAVMNISFRSISLADVPNLTRWQKEPEVDVWWASNGERSFDEVFQKWEQRAGEVIWNLPAVDVCKIDPDPENKRTIRSYEKVGFTYVRSYHSYVNEASVYLMRMEKPKSD